MSAWTSIGYFSQNEDLRVFKQARELSRESAALVIAETTHSDFMPLKFAPTSYIETDNIVMLENRKHDQQTPRLNASWSFYNKQGRNLRFIDTVEFELHVYSCSELCSTLKKG